jgi:hypothetical protein
MRPTHDSFTPDTKDIRMAWFTSRRALKQAAEAETAALTALRDLIEAALANTSRPWQCSTCTQAYVHRPGCPDQDVPFPDADTLLHAEPFSLAFLPLDWRDQVRYHVIDPAAADAAIDLIDAWERADAKNPAEAYLEGVADTHSLNHATLWARASMSTDPAARAALIRAGLSAYEDNRGYRATLTQHRAVRRVPASH